MTSAASLVGSQVVDVDWLNHNLVPMDVSGSDKAPRRLHRCLKLLNTKLEHSQVNMTGGLSRSTGCQACYMFFHPCADCGSAPCRAGHFHL